ncbi:MAG: hypothetical protein J6X11_08030 [Treponema sp.]|nr:hypothetical protein [Treponema sp.]
MAAFAAVSFAEGITFGAWLRALAAPVANDGKDTITAAGNSWGYGARTARINVTAVAPDGNAGFNMGVYNDAESGLGAGDEANLWVKPMDIVKVSYGRYDNNTLRGDMCYGSWNWLRPTSSWLAQDEGLLMSGNGGTGLMAEITPMEELYVQVMLPIVQDEVKAADTYKNLRAGFAYTVPGLVKVKGQYIGQGKGKASDEEIAEATVAAADALAAYWLNPIATTKAALKAKQKALAATEANSNCALEAEVDVLAVEGLSAGLGFRYDVVKDGKDYYGDSQKMKVALGASYQVMPELKVSASGAYFMYYDNDAMKPRFQAGAGVDYDLGDGLAANADFRYLSPAKDADGKKDYTDHMAFSVGVTKSVSSNGYIGVAFQGQTHCGNFGNNVITGKTKEATDDPKNFTWCVPVALSVWF